MELDGDSGSAARDLKRARDEGKSPRRHKSFAADNGCSETKNYYVEPQVSELVDMLVKGSYCVLTGVRQSGKSTSALHVRKLLRNAGFECIYLDLPPHLPDTALSNAKRWQILITAVSRRSSVVCAQPDVEPSDSAFSEMFFWRHEQKNVVLIFDEMNTFGRLPLSFKDSFLATLRAMKLDEDSYCLHSILLIGTDSILAELKISQEKRWAATPDGCRDRTGFEYSPFSHDFRMRSTFFSNKDIEDLLAQYEQDRLIKVEKQAIAMSIFNLTSGHKGLVGVCCAELDAAFSLQSQHTLQMWERFSKQSLAKRVLVKPTYYAMVSVCRGLDEKGRDLILSLLRAQGNVTVPSDQNVECLISDGVVVDNSPDTQLCELSVSSLLLHSALLESLQLQLSIRDEPGPRDFDYKDYREVGLEHICNTRVTKC
ncbi:hypothetical protein GOP47_0026030 [Adiantum capillus-veneris]|uniref:Uncharacterized protein n=1 Tax=Adiantum capillus-veneris TaxID=13818 RepID=A0A9D4Z4Q0_ADICA|nr:hypothetical protein GOP47_0026030 [Adiantum capillus-veneris]